MHTCTHAHMHTCAHAHMPEMVRNGKGDGDDGGGGGGGSNDGNNNGNDNDDRSSSSSGGGSSSSSSSSGRSSSSSSGGSNSSKSRSTSRGRLYALYNANRNGYILYIYIMRNIAEHVLLTIEISSILLREHIRKAFQEPCRSLAYTGALQIH